MKHVHEPVSLNNMSDLQSSVTATYNNHYRIELT